MAAKLHSRMLHGLCSEGVLMIVTMMARLLRDAKIQKGMFTATTSASLIRAAESFLIGIPTHPGTSQLTVSLAVIFFCKDLNEMNFNIFSY